MKTEFTDVSDTRKTVTIEIPSDTVDTAIARVANSYRSQARLPGFRPGKVPVSVVRQRFREQILHDVMHELVPPAVDGVLKARGVEPVSSPDIKDITLKEGQPLTFTAHVETIPPFDPGDLGALTIRRPVREVTDTTVDRAIERLRERAAKLDTVEGRPVADGDSIVADLVRTDAQGQSETHDGVTIQLGATGNPPGFDAQLTGMQPGEQRRFTVHFPADYAVAELADQDMVYDVSLKEIRRKVLPALDDEFAKDVGGFETLAGLRDRVRDDLRVDAESTTRRTVRNNLMKELAARVPFDIPTILVERELDHRLEEFVRQLTEQQIDPRKAGIDWGQFRESQRDVAREGVASTLVLDAIARRDDITIADADVDKEIERFAEQLERTPAALRAQLEKDGGIGRLRAGMRREKAVDLALSRAKMVDDPQSIADE